MYEKVDDVATGDPKKEIAGISGIISYKLYDQLGVRL